jgi:hypothetical protein
MTVTLPEHSRETDIAHAYIWTVHALTEDDRWSPETPRRPGTPGLIQYRSNLYVWRHNFWEIMSRKALEKSINNFLDAALTEVTIRGRNNRNTIETIPLPYTKNTVTNVADLVYLIAQTDDDQDCPAWIDSRSACPVTKLDKVVAFSDVVVDTATLTTYNRDWSWFIPWAHPFPYDPDAEPTEFLAFLRSSFNNDQVPVEVIRRRCGYIQTSCMDMATPFFDIGKPRAGKGVVQRIEELLVGRRYHTSRDPVSISTTHGTEGLDNCRYLTFPEIDKGSDKARNNALSKIVKMIVGRDEVPINAKYQSIASVRINAKVKMIGNDVPVIPDSMGSFWEKVYFLYYPNTFMGREDHELMSRLEAELPAIASWAIRGAQALFGSKPSAKWPVQTEGYKYKRAALAASAPIEEWLHRRTRKGSKVFAQYAYDDYNRYRERLSLPHLSYKAFSMALRNSSAHPTSKKERMTADSNPQIVFHGIALLPPAHSDTDLFTELSD